MKFKGNDFTKPRGLTSVFVCCIATVTIIPYIRPNYNKEKQFFFGKKEGVPRANKQLAGFLLPIGFFRNAFSNLTY